MGGVGSAHSATAGDGYGSVYPVRSGVASHPSIMQMRHGGNQTNPSFMFSFLFYKKKAEKSMESDVFINNKAFTLTLSI
jgi:hypothetical protein